MMGIKKYGTPEPVQPDPGDEQQKTAATGGWNDEDSRQLAAENAKADSEQ